MALDWSERVRSVAHIGALTVPSWIDRSARTVLVVPMRRGSLRGVGLRGPSTDRPAASPAAPAARMAFAATTRVKAVVDIKGPGLAATASMTSPVAVVPASVDQASAATAAKLIVPRTTHKAAAAAAGPTVPGMTDEAAAVATAEPFVRGTTDETAAVAGLFVPGMTYEAAAAAGSVMLGVAAPDGEV